MRINPKSAIYAALALSIAVWWLGITLVRWLISLL